MYSNKCIHNIENHKYMWCSIFLLTHVLRLPWVSLLTSSWHAGSLFPFIPSYYRRLLSLLDAVLKFIEAIELIQEAIASLDRGLYVYYVASSLYVFFCLILRCISIRQRTTQCRLYSYYIWWHYNLSNKIAACKDNVTIFCFILLH